MSGRVDLTSRKGVIAFEQIVINDIQWIFREQSTLDLGIDAIIEEVILSDGATKSTGKLIGVQIKTGMSNVSVDKDGNFVYYMTRVHYEYWLSYSIPVIFVLFDPDTQNTYWSPIVKRNIRKTNRGGYKLIIGRDSIFSKKSKSELTDFLRLSQNHCFFDEDVSMLDDEELLEYSHELLSESVLSLKSINNTVIELDKKIKTYSQQGEVLLSKAQNKLIDKNTTLKGVRKSNQYYKVALNIATTHIKKDIHVMAETHARSISFVFHLLNKHYNDIELQNIMTPITDEFSKEIEVIDDLIGQMRNVVVQFRKSDEYSDFQLRQAKSDFATIVEDFSFEIEDLRELLSESLLKFSQINFQSQTG